MPRRNGNFVRMELLSVDDRLREPDRCQVHWYNLIAPLVNGRMVIEVGAGTGYGVDILRAARATIVHGIDPLPLRQDIINTPLPLIVPKYYDVAVSCDVIEHVESDVDFIRDLFRVAREFVFFSTPNWNVSQAVNPYHVREYTPEELQALLTLVPGSPTFTFYSSDAAGGVRVINSLSEAENSFGVLARL